jgi:cytochrome c biogenesis protein CcmG, thiol:disulfide interchange protein DsbE
VSDHVSRWAGRALLLALALLLGLRVVQLRRQGLPRVTTPRGSAAPDVAGPTLSGDRFRLADERGHPVVLVFWAPWCGPCIGELPGVERVARALRNPPHTARVVTVDTEGARDTAERRVAELGLTLPVVLDDGSASAAYQVSTIPHTVIVDAAGTVAAVMRGPVSESELMQAVEEVERRP